MHTYSKEILYHFRCCVCGQWWTIGDPREEMLVDDVYCPYCSTGCSAQEDAPTLSPQREEVSNDLPRSSRTTEE